MIRGSQLFAVAISVSLAACGARDALDVGAAPGGGVADGGAGPGGGAEGPPPCANDVGAVVLADGLVDPYSMAIGDDFIVVGTLAERSELLRFSKDGGAPETIADGLEYVDYVVVRDDTIYFAEGGGAVYSIRADGSDKQRLASASGAAGLALQGQTLFFADYFGESVESVDLDTLETRTWASDQTAAYRLAVSGQWLFFTSALQGLHTVNMSSGEEGTLGDGYPRSVATVGDHVYWGMQYMTGLVLRAPVGSARTDTFGDFSAFGMNPESFAHDGSHLYVALQGTEDLRTGAIARASLASGAPELVATARTRVLAQVAVDQHCVYWTERGEVLSDQGLLMRAKKP